MTPASDQHQQLLNTICLVKNHLHEMQKHTEQHWRDVHRAAETAPPGAEDSNHPFQQTLHVSDDLAQLVSEFAWTFSFIALRAAKIKS